jgi:hypothetical protein
MKLEPQKILSGSDLQDALMAAKTKAQVIDILCARAGQHGWFSDMPEGLFEKLQGYRSSPQKP